MLEPFIDIFDRPKLKNAKLVMGFSGWMNGGEASTGTIEYLISKLHASKFAKLDPREFYIYSFPGSMEVSSLFRPHTRIKDGLVEAYTEQTSEFFYSEAENIIMFRGKEPNIRWEEFGDSMFAMAAEFNVTRIYFVGAVAGMAPHTREPRLFGLVSDEALKPLLQQYGLRPSNYEGPASVMTYLMTLARERGVEMVTIVVEIPSYIQGRNVKSIEAVVRKLATALEWRVDLDDLKLMSDDFDKRLGGIVDKKTELADLIRKMESDYDQEVLDTEMPDLKAWLEQQNIRLD
jgi:proteasome assembly chaperone (PAC2) family protein